MGLNAPENNTSMHTCDEMLPSNDSERRHEQGSILDTEEQRNAELLAGFSRPRFVKKKSLVCGLCLEKLLELFIPGNATIVKRKFLEEDGQLDIEHAVSMRVSTCQHCNA